MGKKLTLEEVKLRLKKINPHIEILSEEYINSWTKLECKCRKDGHIWFTKWDNLLRGKGCPACFRRKLSKLKSTPNGNSVSDLRPDLIKYFPTPEDANNFSVSSHKKVTLICQDCGKEKLMTLKNLSNQGFSCSHCSDGISIPEKFAINLFKQLGVEFTTQKIFTWAKDKRYDISFEMNKEVCIIEIHGEQHYEEHRGAFKSKSLKEEQNNDKLKYNSAIQNGIKQENYIVVDTRNSDFDWLKDNFKKSLNNIFDLSNVDWNEVWMEAQSSLVIKVCKYWENKKADETTKTLANKFGLSRVSIRNYLKRGNRVRVVLLQSRRRKVEKLFK